MGLVAFLLLLVGARYFTVLATPVARVDERFYVRAFEAVGKGESPYQVDGYLYPPLLAVVGDRLTGALGEVGALRVIRGLNLLGLTFIAWYSAGIAVRRPGRRFVLALALATLSAPLVGGTLDGNIAHVVTALVLAGLSVRSAWGGGFLLGLGLAIKPVALTAIPLLWWAGRHGTGGRSDRPRRRAWVAAGALMAVTGLVGARHLLGLAAVPEGPVRNLANLSLSRWVWTPSWIPGNLLLLGVGLILGLVCLRRRRSRRELGWTIVTSSLLALPVVWSHTLALSLPLQVAAADRALRRWRSRTPGAPRRSIEASMVLLGCVVVQLSRGVSAGGLLPPLVQGFVASLPLVSIVAMTIYLLSLEEPQEGRSGRR